MAPQPQIIIIAGPNGAGKSTSATLLVPADFAFVNADEIAKTLTDIPPEQRDIHAGRIMLATLDDLEARRQSFAVETTLANRALLRRIERLKSIDYDVFLIFIRLQAVDLSILRVAERVRFGGHNIPEETIRRRYMTGFDNFQNLYSRMVDGWKWYDNSELGNPRLINFKPSAGSRKMLFGGRCITGEDIDDLVRHAVRNALADHKAAGNPVAEWRDGKVVIVQPEDIDLSVFDKPASN